MEHSTSLDRVRVPMELYQQLQALAARRGVNTSTLIREILQEAVSKNQ